jgi:broad specificity phosphatase PhoE
MSVILFIRHAQTDLAGKFCGHTDPGLNAAGEQQLVCLVEEVASIGIRRIYSSDLRRASQTAAAIGRRIGVEVELRPGLREIDFGFWEGLNWEEIERRYPQEAKLWLNEFPRRSAPGGENYADFVSRVEAECIALLRETSQVITAVVTHRGVMRYGLTRFFSFSAADAWKTTGPYGTVVIASRAGGLRDLDQTIAGSRALRLP